MAAGSGLRMGQVDKATLPLLGRPVIDWVLDAFHQVPRIESTVVVVGGHNNQALRKILDDRPAGSKFLVVEGGDCRARSVANGIAALTGVDLVVIHDVARPLVTAGMIEFGLGMAEQRGAAIAVAPVSDTIKQVDAAGDIVGTIDRGSLRAAQTPQIFRADWLRRAYELFASSGGELDTLTDEAMLMERAGFRVATFLGSADNIKLTTPADLRLAETLLARRLEEAVR